MYDLFDKAFDRHTKGIPDYQFRHYNTAMGCFIYNKDHYKHEMIRRGLVPYEESLRLAEKWDKEHAPKQYKGISPKAESIIKSLRLTADKNGNIKLGGNAINALKEIGAIKPQNPYAPKHIQPGGFSD